MIPVSQRLTVVLLSTATIEQFQSNPASLLAAVEHGETILISRGAKPVARLSPVEEAETLAFDRDDWFRAAEQSLSRAYAPDEPDYGPDKIVEPNPHYQPCERVLSFCCGTRTTDPSLGNPTPSRKGRQGTPKPRTGRAE